jgi:hypothetical protein
MSLLILMMGHAPQGLEIAPSEPADARERLGSRSEVQRFRVGADCRAPSAGLR